MSFGIEPDGQPVRHGGALHAAKLEHQARLHAPGIQGVRRLHEARVLAADDPGSRQDVGEHFAAAEGVGPFIVGVGDDDWQRDRKLVRRPRCVCSPSQHSGGERTGDNVVTPSPAPKHQSICLRMKVGISISFSSGFSGSCAGPFFGAISDGFANPGIGTGVGRDAPPP